MSEKLPDEIHVKSQQELDAIPADYPGLIVVEFGTPDCRAVVRRGYARRVVARGNASVVARENASVEARENASVEAWGNASVEAWGNAKIDATANAQVCDHTTTHRITLSGNSRVVYDPRTLAEYLDVHCLDHDEHRGRFFKAVHRDENGYHSDWLRGFRYEIGKTVISACDPDPDMACGKGIHMSDLGFALCFGAEWPDLAILELEADLDKIIFPNGGEKVRTSSATVIREVPLEECGLYGKILAKRIAQREVR